jgi:hypothetical protein
MNKKTLPTLPSMLFKALLTLKRKAPSERNLINLPLEQNFENININVNNLKQYENMFQRLLGNVPLTYLYLIAQRAQVSMMLHANFPFRIPGLIHINNKMNLLHQIDLLDTLSVSQQVKLDNGAKSGTEKIIFKTYFHQKDKLYEILCDYRYSSQLKFRGNI